MIEPFIRAEEAAALKAILNAPIGRLLLTDGRFREELLDVHARRCSSDNHREQEEEERHEALRHSPRAKERLKDAEASAFVGCRHPSELGSRGYRPLASTCRTNGRRAGLCKRPEQLGTGSNGPNSA